MTRACAAAEAHLSVHVLTGGPLGLNLDGPHIGRVVVRLLALRGVEALKNITVLLRWQPWSPHIIYTRSG